MPDSVRTTMRGGHRGPSAEPFPWPLVTGLAAGIAVLVAGAHGHLSTDIAFTIAPLAGLGVAWLTSKVPLTHKLTEVEVTADAVRIGQRSFSLAEGAAQLKGRELQDRALMRTLEVMLKRKKAKRASLAVRDLHALVTYFDRDEGLRVELETAAWGMVNQGKTTGSKGPELKVWVAEGRVVRGEFVTGEARPDPDVPVPEGAWSYLVPTRFELPSQGRAWLKTEVERAQRAES